MDEIRGLARVWKCGERARHVLVFNLLKEGEYVVGVCVCVPGMFVLEVLRFFAPGVPPQNTLLERDDGSWDMYMLVLHCADVCTSGCGCGRRRGGNVQRCSCGRFNK